MIRKFFRIHHLPAYIIMATLFGLSSQSGFAQGWIHPPWDKLVHGIAYFVLGLSFCLWIRPQRWQAKPLLYAFLVIGAVAVFGISDEYHQSMVPGRTASVWDWLADVVGGGLAALLYVTTRSYQIYSRFLLKLFP